MAKAKIDRIVPIRSVKRDIRFVDGTVDLLESHGRSVAQKANTALGESEDYKPGYRMSSVKGKSRHRVTVMAVSNHAARHDRKHNALLKALSSE